MHRIVSLIASSTEIVHALGFGDQMVGRSHECDYPEGVKELPVCTEPKFRTDGTSYEIDQRVRAVLQEALSVYRVDAAKLESLKPSHIITQTQCEVCAVSLADVEAAACRLISSKPTIVSLEPNQLADIWQDILRIGTALGAKQEALALIARLKKRVKEITEKVQGRQKPKIAFIEWLDPLMTGGNWLPELIELAGGENVFADAKGRAPRVSWQDFQLRDPDVIVVSPCGFDLERTRSEMGLLKGNQVYEGLRAVASGRVFLVDGNQFMNRPGPRIVDSLAILAEIMHPALFPPEHQGHGWLRYSG
ncbi:MAG: cobalamin-binding protein [Candidatus Melainabacteria bacterium]|nr:MAG: cobalamin-binding protein [Candidatus Melainabacteria bacterium]